MKRDFKLIRWAISALVVVLFVYLLVKIGAASLQPLV
jgi:hypothetical protein